jgi:hypothetical protein
MLGDPRLDIVPQRFGLVQKLGGIFGRDNPLGVVSEVISLATAAL